MIKITNALNNKLIAPVRTFRGKVEFYNNSTSFEVKHSDYLKSFTVERVGDTSKFFGFGVCQKANVKLRDVNRELTVTAGDSFYLALGCTNTYTYFTPTFKVTEVNRDENTNELSITGYDTLYFIQEKTIAELALVAPYSIKDILDAIIDIYDDETGLIYTVPDDELFTIAYGNGANFDGSETLREVLDAIAEATQTAYFIDANESLVFKKMTVAENAVLTINNSLYIDLDSKTNRRLAAICHCTALGDNVEAKLDVAGTTQYVRDNPFWELQENIDTLVNNALTAVGGLTLNQFVCSWRGNFAVEPLDKIEIITKNGESVYSYVINDVISFDGTLSQNTEWLFEDNESETASNPTSLGDTLKATYARVDKANRQIEIVASETASNSASISAIRADTENIGLSVTKLEQTTTDAFAGVNADITTLKQSASLALTEKDVQIKIETELAKGVNNVTTATGFTFNDEGLTVSKSNSEMSTTITEDGMTVYRDSTEVLVADHKGVKAKDLHAETYLIIGTNSRFEDYGNNRTGCFWIGG